MITTYKNFWKNTTNFKGYTRRKSYWTCFGINWGIRLILLLLAGIMLLKGDSNLMKVFISLCAIYCLMAVLPSISMAVRRYRDANLTPWLLVGIYALPILLKFTTRYLPADPDPLSLYILGMGISLTIFICLTLSILMPLFPNLH